MTGQFTIDGKAMLLSKDRYLIGRGDGCDILLPETDMAVSRCHALIERNVMGEWQMLDISSRNGTLVNNEYVADRYTLKDGDVIHIGSSEIKLTLPRSIPTIYLPATGVLSNAIVTPTANSSAVVAQVLASAAPMNGRPISPVVTMSACRSEIVAPQAQQFANVVESELATISHAAEPGCQLPVVSTSIPEFFEMPTSHLRKENAATLHSVPLKSSEHSVAKENAEADAPVPPFASGTVRTAPKTGSAVGGVLGMGIVGALAGGIIGFTMRPSILGIQVPLLDVLTLGSNYQGMLFSYVKSLCVTSFIYLASGVALGAFVGIAAAAALGNIMRNSAKTSAL